MVQATEPVIIKKYANRRLYNTETSTYITQADLAGIIRGGQNVEVVDAKTGEDLTRQTLAQMQAETPLPTLVPNASSDWVTAFSAARCAKAGRV